MLTDEEVCPRCEHSNVDVITRRTLFRRRIVNVCSGPDEPTSGMAGDFVCPCRGPFHQVNLVQGVA